MLAPSCNSPPNPNKPKSPYLWTRDDTRITSSTTLPQCLCPSMKFICLLWPPNHLHSFESLKTTKSYCLLNQVWIFNITHSTIRIQLYILHEDKFNRCLNIVNRGNATHYGWNWPILKKKLPLSFLPIFHPKIIVKLVRDIYELNFSWYTAEISWKQLKFADFYNFAHF